MVKHITCTWEALRLISDTNMASKYQTQLEVIPQEKLMPLSKTCFRVLHLSPLSTPLSLLSLRSTSHSYCISSSHRIYSATPWLIFLSPLNDHNSPVWALVFYHESLLHQDKFMLRWLPIIAYGGLCPQHPIVIFVHRNFNVMHFRHYRPKVNILK